MIVDVSKSLKNRIDYLLRYSDEDAEKDTINITGTIYTYDKKMFSLARYFSYRHRPIAKNKDDVLIHLSTPITGSEYRLAFEDKYKMLNFFDADSNYIQVNDNSGNKIGYAAPPSPGTIDNDHPKGTNIDIYEISLYEAFKYNYLEKFVLFIKGHFIFWSDITYIHSNDGDYLRVKDRDFRFTFKGWQPQRDDFVIRGIGKDHTRTHEMVLEEKEGPYLITNDDIVLMTLPVAFSYTETSFANKPATALEYQLTKANSELIFDRDGRIVTDNIQNIENWDDSAGYAYLCANINKEYYIRTSWVGGFIGSEDFNIREYFNLGKKIYFKNLMVFDQDKLLYLGQDADFDTFEEIAQATDRFYYAMVTSNNDNYMKFPISLKDEFVIHKGELPVEFNQVLSIPFNRRNSYSEVAKIIADFAPSLLKTRNKQIVSTKVTFKADKLKNNILSMSRYYFDAPGYTYVMIFCEDNLISNYHTIEYSMDTFSIKFTNEEKAYYDGKVFEIIYFIDCRNGYAVYDKATLEETQKGYQLSAITDPDNLRLFVDRTARDSFPYIVHDDKTQYEITGRIKEEEKEYQIHVLGPDSPKTVTLLSRRIKLDDEYYYNKKVAFVSSRQFRYNSIYFEDTIGEFRYEFDDEFKFCRDFDRFMVFYNGIYIDPTKYYIIFPDPKTAYNSTSIYLKFRCEAKSRLDIFYIPNRLVDINDDCIIDNQEYKTIIKYNGEDEFIANDLCFIFVDGKKIPSYKLHTIGKHRIVLDGKYSPDSEIIIFKHTKDKNEDYIKSLDEDNSVYETLLDSNEYIDGINRYPYHIVPDINESEIIPKDIIPTPKEELDGEIFDRIIEDYYHQVGVRLSEDSIPMQLEVIGTTESINGHGAILLAPSVPVYGTNDDTEGGE